MTGFNELLKLQMSLDKNWTEDGGWSLETEIGENWQRLNSSGLVEAHLSSCPRDILSPAAALSPLTTPFHEVSGVSVSTPYGWMACSLCALQPITTIC